MRRYAKYIHELVRSNKSKLLFQFVDRKEAKNCLRSVRECIDRNDYNLSAYRVNNEVYVEKI